MLYNLKARAKHGACFFIEPLAISHHSHDLVLGIAERRE
jgi:hypothetical protein